MNKPTFRAWDKINKKMCDVWELDLKSDSEEVLLSDDWDGAWADFQDIILMQSTGLKDKNGVEIFEGDILRYNKNKGNKYEQGEVCEVVWSSDGCWKVGQLRFAQINSMEVLGNVYENLELFDDDSIYGNPELLNEVSR